MGVILRAVAFPLVTSARSFPLLSHHLNLNKSNPSWPHPPASAFLPRGPEAPTTQAVWRGGGTCIAAKERPAYGEHMHTVQMLPTLFLTRSSTAHTHTHMCSYSAVCAQPSSRHEPCACPHRTHVHRVPPQCPVHVHTAQTDAWMLYHVSIRDALVYNSHSCNHPT